MPERPALLKRLFLYMRRLFGHGWEVTSSVLLTVYSLWTLFAPEAIQQRLLAALYIDPHQRLAVWLAALVIFLFYAGFRAWDEEHALVEHSSESATAKELAILRTELDEIHSREWSRLSELQKTALVERLRQIGSGIEIWIIRPNTLDCVALANDFYGVFRRAQWKLIHDEPYSPGEEKLGITIQTLMSVAPALQAAMVETTGLPAGIYEIPERQRRSWDANHVVLSIGLKP